MAAGGNRITVGRGSVLTMGRGNVVIGSDSTDTPSGRFRLATTGEVAGIACPRPRPWWGCSDIYAIGSSMYNGMFLTGTWKIGGRGACLGDGTISSTEPTYCVNDVMIMTTASARGTSNPLMSVVEYPRPATHSASCRCAFNPLRHYVPRYLPKDTRGLCLHEQPSPSFAPIFGSWPSGNTMCMNNPSETRHLALTTDDGARAVCYLGGEPAHDIPEYAHPLGSGEVWVWPNIYLLCDELSRVMRATHVPFAGMIADARGTGSFVYLIGEYAASVDMVLLDRAGLCAWAARDHVLERRARIATWGALCRGVRSWYEEGNALSDSLRPLVVGTAARGLWHNAHFEWVLGEIERTWNLRAWHGACGTLMKAVAPSTTDPSPALRAGIEFVEHAILGRLPPTRDADDAPAPKRARTPSDNTPAAPHDGEDDAR